MRLRSAGLAVVGSVLAVPAAAQALIDIEVCNRSSYSAFVAVAYQPAGSGNWLSEGWFTVNSAECLTVAHTDNAYFYLYAEVNGDSSKFWGGNHSDCVEYPGPFEIWSNAGDSCESHQHAVNFVTMHVEEPGLFTWNLDP